MPFLDNVWAIVAVLAVARSTGAAGSALNFALVTDLVRNPANIGKVTSITVLGGNSFGLMGPIVTGYVVQLSGSFNGTFVAAGVLALIGAAATLTLTRQPIEAEARSAGPRQRRLKHSHKRCGRGPSPMAAETRAALKENHLFEGNSNAARGARKGASVRPARPQELRTGLCTLKCLPRRVG